MNDFFSTFGRAFWSPLAYKNALAWKWKLLAYFCLLTLLSSLCLSYSIFKSLYPEVEKVFKEVGAFHIIDGEVKTKEDKLYTYNMEDGVGLLALSEKPYVGENEYMIILEGDKAIINSYSRSTTYYLKDLGLDGDILIDENFVGVVMAITLLPILFISSLISNAFFVLILSIAAFIMTLTSPLKLGFSACVKISILAITPMVFFQSVGALFSLQDSAGFLYGIISIILVWYMIKKLPEYYEPQA